MINKIVKTAGIVLVSTWIAGCGVENLVDGIGGSGSDSVSYAKTSDGFKITLDGIDSDFVHVKYTLKNADGREKLSYGMNYKGTVTTKCTKTGATSDGIKYACTTKYDTSSPVGDPSDKESNIVLSTSGNTLTMKEVGGFGKDDKSTKIKSF